MSFAIALFIFILVCALAVVFQYVLFGDYLKRHLKMTFELEPQEVHRGEKLRITVRADPDQTFVLSKLDGYLIAKKYEGYTGSWRDRSDLRYISSGEILTRVKFSFGNNIEMNPGEENKRVGVITIPDDAPLTEFRGVIQVRWIVNVRARTVFWVPPGIVQKELFVVRTIHTKKSRVTVSSEEDGAPPEKETSEPPTPVVNPEDLAPEPVAEEELSPFQRPDMMRGETEEEKSGLGLLYGSTSGREEQKRPKISPFGRQGASKEAKPYQPPIPEDARKMKPFQPPVSQEAKAWAPPGAEKAAEETEIWTPPGAEAIAREIKEFKPGEEEKKPQAPIPGIVLEENKAKLATVKEYKGPFDPTRQRKEAMEKAKQQLGDEGGFDWFEDTVSTKDPVTKKLSAEEASKPPAGKPLDPTKLYKPSAEGDFGGYDIYGGGYGESQKAGPSFGPKFGPSKEGEELAEQDLFDSEVETHSAAGDLYSEEEAGGGPKFHDSSKYAERNIETGTRSHSLKKKDVSKLKQEAVAAAARERGEEHNKNAGEESLIDASPSLGFKKFGRSSTGRKGLTKKKSLKVRDKFSKFE